MLNIDKVFRQYGEDFFGKDCMDQISNFQVEEARVWACNELKNFIEKYGKQKEGTVKALFCNYIFEKFI